MTLADLLAGHTQAHIAREIGRSKIYVNRLARGHRALCDRRVIPALARVLGVDADLIEQHCTPDRRRCSL